MEDKAKKIADLLKVLANHNRLIILCQLIKGEKTVGELLEKVPNITQSALSQHLALMKAHGILDYAKNGQSVTYRIIDERIEKIIKSIGEYYCE